MRNLWPRRAVVPVEPSFLKIFCKGRELHGNPPELPPFRPRSRAGLSLARIAREWSDDDYDVVADGEVVGRIYKANAAPVGSPWMWTLAFWHHEGRAPRDRDGRLCKSWRRE